MKTTYHLSQAKTLLLLVFLMASQSLAFAQPVSRETARQVATTFLDNNGAKSTELTDLSAKAGFSNLYVYTTDNSFVLVAADSRVQPVLGYSLTGPFDIEDMPDNKRAWIQEYSDAIQYAIDHQTRASTKTTQQWNDFLDRHPDAGKATIIVGPLIETKWNQSTPYNQLCPSSSLTGCVATAMAQLMKYWNYPPHGISSHSYIHATYGELSADYGNTYYDWENMTNTYGSSSTPTEKTAVATLMYHCGVSLNMKYSPNSSGASTSNVPEVLKAYFNYSEDARHLARSAYSSDAEWIALLKAELNLLRPIQYYGSGSGAHAFVCDGYRDDDYFHFNWGWGGSCDEYYTINNMNPGPGGFGSGANGIYNDGQGAVVGIHPSTCAADAPSNLTCTQNGRQVTLAWDAANGADSYHVFCDGHLVGQTTAVTLVHVAPFGNSTYYVRSVDADGVLSLSSNSVEVMVDYQYPVVDALSASAEGNDVSLDWTAPDWCYPETPSTTLTYGSGNNDGAPIGYGGTACMYWGHRYPASDLAGLGQLAVYKVSFFVCEAGTYQLFVYQGTTSGRPQTLVLQQTITTEPLEWNSLDLSTPIPIDPTQDLWVFIYDPEKKNYPATICEYEGGEGNYFSTDLSSWIYAWEHVAWLIRTYLTDGVYTYNLYRDGAVIANQISDTHFTDSGLADGTYAYYVKTNYYGGETEASNTVTVTLPEPVVVTQTSQLIAGWNWWTPTVQASVANLEAALDGAGVLINSQDSGFDRFEDGGFIGTLGDDLVPGVMYKLRSNTPCTFTLTGQQPATVTVTIEPGHNWFGYTGETGTIATALGNFMPADGDQIIAADGSTATYNNGWSGTLTTLTKGIGYLYVSTASQSKTLVF